MPEFPLMLPALAFHMPILTIAPMRLVKVRFHRGVKLADTATSGFVDAGGSVEASRAAPSRAKGVGNTWHQSLMCFPSSLLRSPIPACRPNSKQCRSDRSTFCGSGACCGIVCSARTDPMGARITCHINTATETYFVPCVLIVNESGRHHDRFLHVWPRCVC